MIKYRSCSSTLVRMAERSFRYCATDWYRERVREKYYLNYELRIAQLNAVYGYQVSSMGMFIELVLLGIAAVACIVATISIYLANTYH